MHYPPIQLVNDDDQPIGGGSLQVIYTQGLLHRVTGVILLDRDGKILLQRRSRTVATNADRWDISAAGHVDEGESYQEAAEKELAEELGITDLELTEAAYYRSRLSVDGYTLNRYLKIYQAVVPASTTVTINDEVSRVQWFSHEELQEQFKNHPKEFSQGFSEILNHINGWAI